MATGSYLKPVDAVLINPRPFASGINEATIEAPLGILYIAAFLEKEGFGCAIIDASAVNLDKEGVVERSIAHAPLLVGISTNAFSYRTAIEYAKLIKKRAPHIITVLGGPQASSLPYICLENEGLDGVVCGEGEEAVSDIIRNIRDKRDPFQGVKGAVYKRNGQIVRGLPPERIVDLDRLPFPAHHLMPPIKHYRSRARRWPFMGIVTSRGCPCRCCFCSKDVFGSNVSFRSPENVVAEIEYLARHRGIKQLDILDDNFTLNRERCERICDLIIKKSLSISINLQSGVRADRLDEGLLRLLKRAGVFKIAFGVESGDENMLNIIYKGEKLETILNAAQLARKLGMVVIGFFMIGLPYDTMKTARKTIDFAKRMNPHIANFMITIPFHGTPLYTMVEKNGRFLIDVRKGISSGFYGNEVFFELGELKEKDIKILYKQAYREFYSRIGMALDMLGTMRSWHEFHWYLNAFFSIKLQSK